MTDEIIEATELPPATKSERSEEAILEMLAKIEVYVKTVEASVPKTQNHCGAYESVVKAVTGAKNQRAIARHMIKVGANAQGVCDGFKAATGFLL